MNIFWTVDDHFVPQLAAGICSVCENNRFANEIHLWVADFQISEDNKRKLTALAESYRREITFVRVGDLRSLIGFEFTVSGWRDVILTRLLIDKLLPQTVHRVLYLDGDTIVRGDLSELWNMDMEGHVIGASAEPTVNKNRRASLNLTDQCYYNSGVLLINLDAWRENRTGERILRYYAQKDGKLFAPDQDAINGALAGEILTLSPKYNFYNIFWYYPYRTLKKLQSPAEYVSREVFQDAIRNPVIIHYLGEERPWRKGNTHKYANDYFKYLSKTEWRDAPLETGWKLYFICFRLFHTVLKPFPMLRYKIIDSLIPAFMKFRAGKLKATPHNSRSSP